MPPTKPKATGRSSTETSKGQKPSKPHSRSHKRKQDAPSNTAPPPTPPPTDTDAMTPGSPRKRVKIEALESPTGSQERKSPAVDQVFGIHKGLLCKVSSIFQEVLTEGKSTNDLLVEPDSEQMALHLPEEDVAVFTRFNRWLYSSELTLEDETVKDLSWADLICIYLFATKMKVTRLQNKCIDVTIAKQLAGNVLPNADIMNRLWRPDTNAAPLRQLFLQLYARKGDLAKLMALPGNFHAGFMKGLVTELYAMKEGAMEEVKFWKVRKSYYVNDESNPLVVE
ncbi:MAG: hypothetical protein Q9217_004307 [Psora testacea]